MMNQLYSELVKEYRKKYEKQIGEPLKNGEPVNYAGTFHFQRRLLSQFYSDMAMLRYKRCPRLSTKNMREWFTPKKIQLLALLLYMVKPAKTVFEKADEVPEPPEPGDVPMNDLIYKLYEEVRTWE
jgi:hypothetical protein